VGTLDRPRETDAKSAMEPGAEALLANLAELLRGQRLTVELTGERLRVTAEPGRRAVEVACLRRPSDGDRWWFSWGGGIWLCEADNPTEAMVQVKAALRRVGS
jgi:hypothetical protein